jgi:hypothetical protein
MIEWIIKTFEVDAVKDFASSTATYLTGKKLIDADQVDGFIGSVCYLGTIAFQVASRLKGV